MGVAGCLRLSSTMGSTAAIEKLVNGGCRTGFPCSALRTTSRQAHGKIRPAYWRLNHHHQVTCCRTWGPGNAGTSDANLRKKSALQSHSAKQRAGGETDRRQPVRQKGLERPIHSPRPHEDDEDAPVKKSGPPMVVRINSMCVFPAHDSLEMRKIQVSSVWKSIDVTPHC